MPRPVAKLLPCTSTIGALNSMGASKKHPLDRALENIEEIKRTNPDRYNRIINRCWDRYADEIVGVCLRYWMKKNQLTPTPFLKESNHDQHYQTKRTRTHHRPNEP